MIVIGLGSGRSGTASLAQLLNAQKDALCFHEMNPSCVRFHDTPRPILNSIDEFQAIVAGGEPSALSVDLSRDVAATAYDQLCRMPKVRLLGDIAFYYLAYVEAIAAHNPNVRFVCLRRQREDTVRSWERKQTIKRWPSKYLADRLACLITREPFHQGYNSWMEHDGTEWARDPVWDKCFPKFSGPTRRDAIGQYWEYYYQQVAIIEEKLPDVFRLWETETIGSREAHKRTF